MKWSRYLLWMPAAVMMIAGLALLHPGQPSAQTGEKIKIETMDDLPVHAYPVAGSASALLADNVAFAAFLGTLRANVESDLATYEIEDNATLQRMYGTLMTIDMLEGKYDDALANLAKGKEYEEKEASRLTMGMSSHALIAARAETDWQNDDAAFRAAFQKHLAARVDELPWDVVQDDIQSNKGRLELYSENLILGMVQANIDPIVANSGEVSGDVAAQIAGIRRLMTLTLPYKAEMIAVYQAYIDNNQVEKEDIWANRDVALDPGQDLEPVVLGIWDSGVDVSVFGDAIFVNADEKLDGEDTDGNGFVDDIHGIAYDKDGVVSPHLLHPLEEVGDRVWTAMKYTKGLTDLQASIDSPEASELKAHIGGLQPEEVEQFMTDLSFVGLFAHGTHVAGIAGAGNPFAKLLVARISFDYRSIPKPPTREIAEQHAASYHAATRYFMENNVRVVNMSWGWSFKEIEGMLEANGVGETGEERAELARKFLDILSTGLHDAMASTPDILYVAAAGNDD
ncbi:MAG: S8 family serine peptidase, partial [bacterium]